MSESDNAGKREAGQVRVLIEEIKGQINVILSKIDSLVESVDNLRKSTVTREELILTVTPMKEKISNLESFRDKVYYVVGAVALGVLALVLSHAIPGFNL